MQGSRLTCAGFPHHEFTGFRRRERFCRREDARAHKEQGQRERSDSFSIY